MRCSKCNKRLSLFVKFCPNCGTALSREQKKKSIVNFLIWLGVFALLIPVMYYFASHASNAQNYTAKDNFLGAIIVAFFSACGLYLVYKLIRFCFRRPIWGSIITLLILVLAGGGYFFYWQRNSDNQFKSSLALIQDSLVEVSAAKIMGDSIIAKKSTPGASMIRVEATAQMAKNNLDILVVPDTLKNYRDTAIIWSTEIVLAAKDNKNWKNMADHPIDFQLKLTSGQVQRLFKDSLDKIITLKEFGDDAIKRKDTDSMRYIAAKLSVQEHWLSGLARSESSWFPFSSIPSALAADTGLKTPETGLGVDVTCLVCNDTSVHWTAQLRAQYGCDTRCKPQQQNQQPNQQQNKGNQNSAQSGNNSSAGSSGGDYQTPKRKICIGRGGTSTGNSASNVFCVEDAVQSINEIEASTIGIIEGKKGSDIDWDNSWHKEGGLGVISQGEPSSQIQVFNDACKAKGGTVGGNGGPKNRLPSTELGYTCDYKQADNACWDYLTYSGSQYAGGAAGCPEKNLLPDIPEDADAGSTWDGNYPYSATMRCSGNVWKGSSMPVSGTVVVRGNKAVESGISFVVSSSGAATEVIQYHNSQSDEAGNVYTTNIGVMVYYQFYKQDNKGGFNASGSAYGSFVGPDIFRTGTCSGSGSGGRQ